MEQDQRQNSEVVIRSGPEGGSMLTLKFYTSWTSQSKAIVTK